MRAQRWVVAVGATAVFAAVGLSQVAAGSRAPAAPDEPPTTAPQASGTVDPAVSGDGRFVLFTGPPAVDDGRTSTVWLRDRADESVIELTRPVPGLRLGNSVKPGISADGCVAVVVTEMAFDLFRDDDTVGRWDVYRTVLPACGGTEGDWELVSSGGGGGFGAVASDSASPLYAPSVSGSGAVIAYVSRFSAEAPDLVGVMVTDLTVPMGQPGRTRPVAGTPSGAPNTTFRYRGLREPSVSDDGLLVAFTSDANSDVVARDWADGPQPGGFASSQVFVWDRSNTDPATAVVRLSASATAPADGEASSPAVSGDGHFIVFASSSTNLLANVELPDCSATCPTQVYRYDRTDGSLVLVSRVPGPVDGVAVGADLSASQPAITSDGSEILFITRATNLFATRSAAGGGVDDGDVVVANLSKGTLERVSLLADGVTPAPAAQSHARLSSTGRVVVFDTVAGAAFGVDGPGRQVVAVTRRPVLSLADLDVGSGSIGYPGAEWFISVVNQGPSTFLPAIVESSNLDFSVSGGSCTAGIAVPPGGSCTVNVMLTPSRLGTITGTVTVSEFGQDAVSVQSELRGAGGAATLAPDPAGADLAPQLIGQPGEPVVFKVFNVGFGPLTVASVKVEGTHPDDFQVVLTDCPGAQLAIGETCLVAVTFTPTASGRRTATVVVTDRDGEYTTMLVSGEASYVTSLTTTADTLVAGSRLGVGGSGFAPNTVVTLLWADGAGRSSTVTTDSSGGFLTVVVVGGAERPGRRTLVAQSATATATADVTILAAGSVRGPGSAAWPAGH